MQYKDKDTISNYHYELKYAAKKLGVSISDIKKAKEITKSNKRVVIEAYINKENNKSWFTKFIDFIVSLFKNK